MIWTDGLSGLYLILYIFYDSMASNVPFQGSYVGQNKWKLAIFAVFCIFYPRIIISSKGVIWSVGLSDLYCILYIFYDSMAFKDPFPGGNIGQNKWKLAIFAFFVHEF